MNRRKTMKIKLSPNWFMFFIWNAAIAAVTSFVFIFAFFIERHVESPSAYLFFFGAIGCVVWFCLSLFVVKITHLIEESEVQPKKTNHKLDDLRKLLRKDNKKETYNENDIKRKYPTTKRITFTEKDFERYARETLRWTGVEGIGSNPTKK